jgi:hypothetical protein
MAVSTALKKENRQDEKGAKVISNAIFQSEFN